MIHFYFTIKKTIIFVIITKHMQGISYLCVISVIGIFNLYIW